MRTAVILLAVFLPMALEARLAARHERALLAAGAFEPDGDVYAAMRLAYPLCFLAMAIEGWLQAGPAGPAAWAGAAVFVLAKALKYWAVATLGTRWTFRVLVPRRSVRIATGPYRYLRHPNY